MNKTKIEWVKNSDGTWGYTWNPITGCLNHINGMCKGGNFPCYAYRLAHGRLKKRYLANGNIAPVPYAITMDEVSKHLADPFYPREWFNRREPLLESRKPKGVFACDMSDLFGIGIPDSWIEGVLETIKVCPEHRFYLLTKQPQNLPKWFPNRDDGGHSNCWVGSTITNDGMMDATVKAFDGLWSPVRFISFEPLLGRLSKGSLKQIRDCICQWVIIGQKTPVSARTQPKVEWIQEIVEAADKAGIPVFLKDNLRPLISKLSATEALPFYDSQTCELRQEFPK